MSTQQRALVELAVRTKLLVDSVDAYVLAMPSPLKRQRRCLHPVVREGQAGAWSAWPSHLRRSRRRSSIVSFSLSPE